MNPTLEQLVDRALDTLAEHCDSVRIFVTWMSEFHFELLTTAYERIPLPRDRWDADDHHSAERLRFPSSLVAGSVRTREFLDRLHRMVGRGLTKPMKNSTLFILTACALLLLALGATGQPKTPSPATPIITNQVPTSASVSHASNDEVSRAVIEGFEKRENRRFHLTMGALFVLVAFRITGVCLRRNRK